MLGDKGAENGKEGCLLWEKDTGDGLRDAMDAEEMLVMGGGKMLDVLREGCWRWSCRALRNRGRQKKRFVVDVLRKNAKAVSATESDAEGRKTQRKKGPLW